MEIGTQFTEVIRNQVDEWFGTDEISWEDLYQHHLSEEFYQYLKDKETPWYLYMLSYLLTAHQSDLGLKGETEVQKEMKRLRGPVTDEGAGCEDEEFLKICRLVMNDFADQGYAVPGRKGGIKIYGTPDRKSLWDLYTVRKVLSSKACSLDTMFVLAMGLHISADDFDLFLKKAMKREALNLWNPEEMLMYVTLRYAGITDRWDFYLKARETYRQVSPLEGNLVINKGFRTSRISAEMENLFRGLKTGIMDPNNPTLVGFFREYKDLTENRTGYVRSVARECKKLLDDIEENLKEDGQELEVYFSEVDNPLRAEGTVEVYYDVTEGLRIPAGTEFLDRSGHTFITGKETRIRAIDEPLVERQIPVVFTFDREGGNRQGDLDKHTAFTCAEKGFVCGENRSKFKKTGKKDLIGGTVYCVLRQGTILPAGTEFTADGLVFRSEETCRAEWGVAEISVSACDEEMEAVKNTISMARDPLTKEEIPGIKKVSNKKKIGKGRRGRSLTGFLYGQEQIIRDEEITEGTRYAAGLLKGNLLTDTDISNIRNGKTERLSREKIEALVFLQVVTMPDVMDSDYYPKNLMDEFCSSVNDVLEYLGFYGHYIQSHYDCLLAYLMLTDEPMSSYRNLASLVKKGN